MICWGGLYDGVSHGHLQPQFLCQQCAWLPNPPPKGLPPVIATRSWFIQHFYGGVKNHFWSEETDHFEAMPQPMHRLLYHIPIDGCATPTVAQFTVRSPSKSLLIPTITDLCFPLCNLYLVHRLTEGKLLPSSLPPFPGGPPGA